MTRPLACAVAASLALAFPAWAQQAGPARGDRVLPDGSVQAPAHLIPPSRFASPEARAEIFRAQELRRQGATRSGYQAAAAAGPKAMADYRRMIDEIYHGPDVRRMLARYPVEVTDRTIAGVKTAVITPKGGTPERNAHRVLINLHGGAFTVGSPRSAGLIESAPIASLGGYRIISIDYRLAPEHRFPAASEDVAAVYRELLKEYDPGDIGMFGCSAGGVLTGQMMPWLRKEGLPLPGAIGIFCAGGGAIGAGDSGWIAGALMGSPFPSEDGTAQNDGVKMAYFEGVDMNQPLASPAFFPEEVAHFPPTLLVTGTRDFALSSAIYLHTQLVEADIPSELDVWESVQHFFFKNPDLPESQQMYRATVKFFDRHLGKR